MDKSITGERGAVSARVSSMVPCSICRKQLQPHETIWREITGWEQPRDGGGANVIHRRRETGRYAHKSCVEAETKGGSLFQ